MNSKQRVRCAFSHITPDRVPANYEATDSVNAKMMNFYKVNDYEGLLNKLEIDYRGVYPTYIGKELKSWQDGNDIIYETPYGCLMRKHWTGSEYNHIVDKYVFDENTTVQDVLNYNWISADMFDYENIKKQCMQYKDKALIFGHEGPFQLSTFIMSMDDLFVKMSIEPDVAHAIYNKFVEFELEYYERILIAGNGQLDVLRPHDDYGTQQSLLFSKQMWKDYFEDNTKKLTTLAHKYNCLYQQHSCGAVADIIPFLIDCKVDGLEPLQKVKGMEIDFLKKNYGSKLTFQGGLDTQHLLPFGTIMDVENATRRYIDILGASGGYVLMGSQSYENDIPEENINAIYKIRN